jgi:hypothetical protein
LKLASSVLDDRSAQHRGQSGFAEFVSPSTKLIPEPMKLTLLALAAAMLTLSACASKTSAPPPPVDMGVRSGK